MAWEPPVIDPRAWRANVPEGETAGECWTNGYRHEFRLDGETIRFRWPRVSDPDPPWHTCRAIRVTNGFCADPRREGKMMDHYECQGPDTPEFAEYKRIQRWNADLD